MRQKIEVKQNKCHKGTIPKFKWCGQCNRPSHSRFLLTAITTITKTAIPSVRSTPVSRPARGTKLTLLLPSENIVNMN